MNKIVLAAMTALAVGGAAAQATNGVASDPSYTLYRRAVLGENIVVPPSTAKSTNDGRVLGTYALYLLRNGASRSEALAQAQVISESPRFVAAEPKLAHLALSPYQLYEKAVLKKSDAEIALGHASQSRREARAGTFARATH